MPETDAIEIAARRIERWKRSLLDLTLRNRLLDVRDGKQVVPLAGVDPVALATALDEGAELALAPYAPPALDDAERVAEAVEHAAFEALGERRLLVPLPEAEVDRRLVTIVRAAREHLADGGTHTLWVGLGLLSWYELDVESGAPPRRAPLILRPVELRRVGPGARFRLAATADDEPRVNQTLIEKLRVDFGIQVPPLGGDEGEPLDLAAAIELVRAAVAHRPGWRVDRAACAGIFSFAKFVMWTDLEERSERLTRSAVVRHLAGHAGQPFPEQPAFPAADALDGVAIGALLAPLDCDSSQLAAVLAAEQGRSFVLQGPPGTGKSQTISNLIAQCLAAGKTVLFVSEKMAALEVVQRRLAAVGLGDFCLELHSHKARKRQVIEALGKVLERAWRPGDSGAASADDKLAAARAAVNDYVEALHAPTPLGLTVHDALGRLVELRAAPPAPSAPAIPADGPSLAARKEALARWAAAAGEVAPLGDHPWRESQLAEWQLSTADAVAAVVAEVEAATAALEVELAEWGRIVPGLGPRSLDEVDAAARLIAVAARTPRPGVELLAPPRPTAQPPAPGDVPAWLSLARRQRELAARLRERWSDALDALDLSALAARFKRWAGRFFLFRWLALRAARADVRKALTAGSLPDDATVADDLEAAMAELGCRRALDQAQAPARRWLGDLGRDRAADVDLDAVGGALDWARELREAFDAAPVTPRDAAAREASWRALVAAVCAPDGDAAPFARGAAVAERWRTAIGRLRDVAGVDPARLGGDVVAALRAAVARWKPAVPALRPWTAYVRARRDAAGLGLEPTLAAAETGALAVADAPAAWERAVLLAWTDGRIAASPALRDFHGSAHHARVAEFSDLDRAHLAVARARVIARVAERVPRVVGDPSGEVGVLLHEVKKQRRHKPLRALFREIPTLLPRLKPCLLMSPLSVAQYLDPALARFDLVVFDEASQIPTSDAIGALARGDAAVVVGDSRQLPPTRFFDVDPGAGPDAAPDPDDPDGDFEELESVLDECVAARLPELRLGWHYRSRHEDLIAFSNQHYYDDRLSVFPAAAARVAELGVEWRKIDGVYERAGARTNRAEAEAVVAEIAARLRDPVQQKRSIGVVTFSRAQQTLIEDLLDDVRRAEPGLDAFFGDDVAEPLLVKNLETVQGDERDVMLFSIGYGPDHSGAVSLNLGPLNRDGGERRLNVAITRAREKLIVFSTLEPEMLDGATAVGVQHLAAFLAYARRGGGAARADSAPPASPVTAAVARALADRGIAVHHQVGCAGYRLDLAVVDPDDPGRYVLAIEHDGASYRGAATARDRDRLRAQVLSQLGWRLHRIWTLDWWHEPEREIERAYKAAITAIAAARAARKPATRSGPTPRPTLAAGSSPTPTPASRGSSTSTSTSTSTSAPRVARYAAASVPAGRRTPDDLHDPAFTDEARRVIDTVLAAEAPIHVDLLARRVGAYFGIGRVTSRVGDRVRELVRARGRFGEGPDAEVVWRSDQDGAAWPLVRTADDAAETRRDIEEIPTIEIAAAAAVVLSRAVGASLDDLARDTARLLGFARVTDRVARRMRLGIDLLAARGGCRVDNDRASLPD